MRSAQVFHEELYSRLQRMATRLLAQERCGNTLQPTALVNEAFLRLSGEANAKGYADHQHYMGAAYLAMRRVLIESARRKKRLRHGGGQTREPFPSEVRDQHASAEPDVDFHELLDQLTRQDEIVGKLVHLYVCSGLSIEEGARLLNLPQRTAYRYWQYARAWLYQRYKSEYSS